MRVFAALLLLSLPAPAIADCPPVPATVEARAALLAQIRTAPDEATARGLMDRLWRLWTEAPDARAQALLDHGMDRREAYDFAAAEADFDELVGYCPDYAEGWNQRAFVRFLRGNYEACDRRPRPSPGSRARPYRRKDRAGAGPDATGPDRSRPACAERGAGDEPLAARARFPVARSGAGGAQTLTLSARRPAG